MNFEVAPQFERSLKRLRKKFPNLKQDMVILKQMLSANPFAGIHLGAGLYKLRLSNSDIKKGKSGGYRVIYFYLMNNNEIVLLDIYTKNVRETIPVSEIKNILNEYILRKKS